MSNRYVVWIKEPGEPWAEQGDGPLPLRTAERICREIHEICHIPARVFPAEYVPYQCGRHIVE